MPRASSSDRPRAHQPRIVVGRVARPVRRRRARAPGSRGCRRSCRRRSCGTPASAAPAARGTGGTLNADDGRDPVRVQQRRAPHHRRRRSRGRRSPPFGADVVEQTDEVGGQLDDVVGVDVAGRVRRAAVAALIGRQHVVAGRRPAPGSGDARSRPVRGSRGPAPPPVRRDSPASITRSSTPLVSTNRSVGSCPSTSLSQSTARLRPIGATREGALANTSATAIRHPAGDGASGRDPLRSATTERCDHQR